MRTSFSTIAILASSLLAREIIAAPHGHKHQRAVVTDTVVVTEEIFVTQEADGSYSTAAPKMIGMSTILGSSAAASTPVASPTSIETSASETPSSTVLPVSSAAISLSVDVALVQHKESSSAEATSTTPAAYVPAKSSSASSSSSSVIPTPSSTYVAPTTSSTYVAPTTSSTSVAPTTSSTSTSSSATSTSSSSSSSGKRGLAYNDASLLSGFLSDDNLVSWAYNWASTTATIPSGLEFVPTLWGLAAEFTDAWTAAADLALLGGSTYLMSFNEPDDSGQADLSVSDAVDGYITYMMPYASKAQIGTPAVTNGGSPMGLTYLGEFITQLNAQGGSFDFCAIHWYDTASNIAYFKNYMAEASATCGSDKKLWLTEFGATGTADEQNTFLETVLPWLDEQDYMERYAYFMVETDNLISTGTTLSTLGETYATFT